MHVEEDASRELEPAVIVHIFGYNLIAGQWTVDEACTHLATTMQRLGCDSPPLAEDFATLSEQAGTELLSCKPQALTAITRLATRGIVLQEYTISEPTSPTEKWTEGMSWKSESGQAHLEHITSALATNLKALIDGMCEAGCPRPATEELARAEIESLLDDSVSDVSRRALYSRHVLPTIEDKAGLTNVHTRLRRLQRAWNTWRALGVPIMTGRF